MEANNFRIGNWVNGEYRGFSRDVQIYGMDKKDIQHTYESVQPLPPEYFNPIILTREWFIKLGFTRKRHGQAYYLENLFSLEFTQDPNSIESNTWFLIRQGSSKILSKPIRYVHELQNLFFAITGDELQLKNES